MDVARKASDALGGLAEVILRNPSVYLDLMGTIQWKITNLFVRDANAVGELRIQHLDAFRSGWKLRVYHPGESTEGSEDLQPVQHDIDRDVQRPQCDGTPRYLLNTGATRLISCAPST
jgi:hypothetical protein